MKHADLAVLLRHAVPGIEANGTRRWKLPGLSARAGVRIDAQWATFGCAMPRPAGETPVASLLRQSALRGDVKLVWGRTRMTLRAEVPLHVATPADRAWVASQCREVVRGFSAACGAPDSDDDVDPGSGIDTDPDVLVERCKAAGWQAVAKADGEVRVDIEARSVRRVVGIVREGSTLRVAVALGSGQLPQASADSLRAVALFLVRASSSLRFARAWASGSAVAPSEVGFECTMRPPAGDAPLVSAIDALGTACDLFGREAEALIESTALARQYLNRAGGIRAVGVEPVVPRRAPAAVAAGLPVVSESVAP